MKFTIILTLTAAFAMLATASSSSVDASDSEDHAAVQSSLRGSRDISTDETLFGWAHNAHHWWDGRKENIQLENIQRCCIPDEDGCVPAYPNPFFNGRICCRPNTIAFSIPEGTPMCDATRESNQEGDSVME